MKRELLLCCLLFTGILTAFADKTIYVSPTGNGNGLTTETPTSFPQALGTLDATGYTTIVLSNNSTFVLSGGTTGYGRIPIVDNSKIIIEGNNSILEGNGAETRILRASTGCRLTLKNLTFRLGNAGSSLGGAIFFGGDSLIISGCIFERNTSDNGAAIGSRGNFVKITNSWFKDNYIRSSFQGAAISHTGTTSGGKLIVENTTFSNNLGKVTNSAAYGTAIITAFDGNVRNYLSEISITNCTFFKNNASLNTTSGYAAVHLDYLGSTAPAGTATTATLVNNTFYGNSDASIRILGKQQAVRLINNVIVGDSWASVSTASVQDHGIICEFSVAEGRPALLAKNNYIVSKYPKSSKNDDTALALNNTDNNTLVTTISQRDIDTLGLSATLQTANSPVPYLSITNEFSPLVNHGTNLVSGITIPDTDLKGVTRGSLKTGSNYDIGAFEYVAISTDIAKLDYKDFYVVLRNNQITIANNNDNIMLVKIFLSNGQLVYAGSSKKSLNIATSLLPKGVLILNMNNGATSTTKKILL